MSTKRFHILVFAFALILSIFLAGQAQAAPHSLTADSRPLAEYLPGQVETISAGNLHTCARKGNGSLICWGAGQTDTGIAPELGQSIPPAGLFKQVSSGDSLTCGVMSDGSLACWGGDSNYNDATVPSGNDFAQVSGGGSHACALRNNGSITCWGYNDDYGQAPADPYPSETFVQVSAGAIHTCAVKTDGTLQCWGWGEAGEGDERANPPAGTFLQVSAGTYHSCGLKTDETVVCWGAGTVDTGWPNFGQSIPPADTFKQISAGYGHTCGIKTDNTVECWGWDFYSQSTPISDTFAQVSSGREHTCGVQTNGNMVCWGGDSEGQSSVPNMNPPARFHVQLTQNNVEGYGWPPNTAITLTIDDPSSGVGTDFTDTQTSSPSGNVQFNNVGGIELEDRMYVTMTDGVVFKDHTVTILTLTGVDPGTDTVSGTATPGVFINTWVQCGAQTAQRYVFADVNGDWTADYSIIGIEPEEQTLCNIGPGSYGEVMEPDAETDHTDIDWSLPNPRIGVRPRSQNVEGWEWPLGATVTVAIDDPLTPSNPDASDSTTVIEAPWNSAETWFNVDFNGVYQIKAGDVVTVYDGTTTKTHTVTNYEITNLNPAVDTVSGTADPGTTVDLWICDPGGCVSRTETANGSGDWSANFGVPGDQDWEQSTFDILPGTEGDSAQWDGERDGTMIWWGQLPYGFGKNAPSNGATGLPTSVTLSWENGGNALSFEYCYDTTNDNACSTWIPNGAASSVTLNGLARGTNYYWQVRALNETSTMYANGDASAFWSFRTSNAPASFNKSAPANGATDLPFSLTVNWGGSAGASSYEVCYDTSNNGVCNASWIPNGMSTSKTLSGLNSGTTYYWQVRAKNPYGTTYANGSESNFWSFTTGFLPGAFAKTTPVNGAINQPTSLNLNWSVSTNAASYAYCIDTTNDNNCSGWINVGTNTTAAISGLTPNTVYYWHVRANNAFGNTYANGAINAFWNFRIGAPPANFGKSSPGNGAMNQPISVTLTWNSSANVDSYEYCYDTLNNSICDTGWVSNGLSTSVPLSGLSMGTTYYWHVRAVNAFGTTYTNNSGSAFWSFTIGAPPAAFTKSQPANGTVIGSTSVTLRWASSPGATSYEYCLDTTNDSSCSTSWLSNGASTQKAMSGLASAITYYWHVRANNTFGQTYANGSASAFWSFSISMPPSTPTLVSPANNALLTNPVVLFDWNNSTVPSGAVFDHYQLQVAIDNGFLFMVSDVNVTGINNSQTTIPLASGAGYYWRVRAWNTAEESSAWSFVRYVKIAYAAPTLLTPVHGSQVSSLTPTFDWTDVSGVVSYTIQISRSATFSYYVSSYSSATSNFTLGSPLLAHTTYYWRVRVDGLFGPSAWSTIFRFTTP